MSKGHPGAARPQYSKHTRTITHSTALWRLKSVLVPIIHSRADDGSINGMYIDVAVVQTSTKPSLATLSKQPRLCTFSQIDILSAD